MIFLVMALALFVLLLWSLVSVPRVVRHTSPWVRIWFACWLIVAGVAFPALLATGFESMGWGW